MKTIWAISLEKMPPARRPVNALAPRLQALLGGKEGCRVEYIEVAMPKDAVRLSNNTLIPWDDTLSPDELLSLPCTKGRITNQWPDIVITAHQTMGGPIGQAIKDASGGRTKFVQVQGLNAQGAPSYDQGKVDVLIPQPHEDLATFRDEPNVLFTDIAIHDLTPERQSELRAELEKITPSMKHPALAVILGGSDRDFVLTEEDFAKLGREVAKQSRDYAEVYVVSMSRTTPAQLEALRNAVQGLPNVHIDDKRFTYDHIVASAAPAGEKPDAALVTCEGSLVNHEAMSVVGKRVSTYPYATEKYENLLLVKQGTWPRRIAEQRTALYPEFAPPSQGMEADLLGLGRQILRRIGLEPAR